MNKVDPRRLYCHRMTLSLIDTWNNEATTPCNTQRLVMLMRLQLSPHEYYLLQEIAERGNSEPSRVGSLRAYTKAQQRTQVVSVQTYSQVYLCCNRYKLVVFCVEFQALKSFTFLVAFPLGLQPNLILTTLCMQLILFWSSGCVSFRLTDLVFMCAQVSPAIGISCLLL